MAHRVVWLEGDRGRVRRNVDVPKGASLPEILPRQFGTGWDGINGTQWRFSHVDEYGEAFYRPEKVTR